MNTDHVEALLLWNEGGADESVPRWFRDHGFGVAPMRAGLLVSGPPSQFETVFGVDLVNAEPPIQLPLPRNLKQHAASFGIPKPRQYH
jgi:hypothetical protein